MSAWDNNDVAWRIARGNHQETATMQERKEVRCGHCNRLLGKGEVLDFEMKCPRCKTINHVRAESPCSEPPEGQNGANCADQEKGKGY